MIATNGSDEVQQQAKYFLLEDYTPAIVTGVSPNQSAFIVVTMYITDNKNRPVQDGSLIKAVPVIGTLYDVPLQYYKAI